MVLFMSNNLWKHLNILSVIKPIVSTVNFIHSTGLILYQFCKFLSGIEAEHPDLSYYIAVSYLRSDKVLLGDFDCRAKIKVFLNEYNPSQLLKNGFEISFCCRLENVLNKFNLILSGKTVHICETSAVKLFWQQLMLNHKLLLYILLMF